MRSAATEQRQKRTGESEMKRSVGVDGILFMKKPVRRREFGD